jgi:hypothetical protein
MVTISNYGSTSAIYIYSPCLQNLHYGATYYRVYITVLQRLRNLSTALHIWVVLCNFFLMLVTTLARARVRPLVLAEATWPCAWFLP